MNSKKKFLITCMPLVSCHWLWLCNIGKHTAVLFQCSLLAIYVLVSSLFVTHPIWDGHSVLRDLFFLLGRHVRHYWPHFIFQWFFFLFSYGILYVLVFICIPVFSFCFMLPRFSVYRLLFVMSIFTFYVFFCFRGLLCVEPPPIRMPFLYCDCEDHVHPQPFSQRFLRGPLSKTRQT